MGIPQLVILMKILALFAANHAGSEERPEEQIGAEEAENYESLIV